MIEDGEASALLIIPEETTEKLFTEEPVTFELIRNPAQGILPEVLAAVVRAASAVRGVVALEHGATGPWKDCGYEGIILKAVSGRPISMEGKSATCAHSSPLGNIASAACDLWSNESVQNVQLLSGKAPVAPRSGR